MYKILKSLLLPFLASGIIASGWGWYHFDKHNKVLLTFKVGIVAILVVALYFVGKYFLAWLLKKYNRHVFWQTDFIDKLDGLFLVGSLLFAIFFSPYEIISLVYSGLWIAVLFYYLHRLLAKHPLSTSWQEVNKRVGVLVFLMFLFQGIIQYAAYHYYILDSQIRFFNIVVFRSVAMSTFWLTGFAVASLLFWCTRAWWRYLATIVWMVIFLFNLVGWVVNIGILYYSGLYFSPSALEHTDGAGAVIFNTTTYLLIALALVLVVLFVITFRTTIVAHRLVPRRIWQVYAVMLVLIGLVCVLGLSSFKTTPERRIVKSFIDHYFGTEVKVTLPPELFKKLERFGLMYDLNQFAVAKHAEIYNPAWCAGKMPATKSPSKTSLSTCPALLADKFTAQKPNILIVFLESYSARLNGVYNPKFVALTPGLNAMAGNKNTTVFKNYYNASTPTITGIISELCSFLPPIGHNEIQNDRKLQSHHLLCLPEVLKRNGGYKYANYITAVDKDYAHKDGIFTSMSIDDVFGTTELARYIPGEPLSWGYSDHQMFPTLLSFMKSRRGQQPFFMSLSTVDTHPPFNLSKDEVPYGDGKKQVLNSFHTTDDAFLKFWNEFQSSEFASNTIVVAMADHAIFPAALTKDLFPEDAGKLTYYDENTFMMYVPDSHLPREVTTTASGIDVAPTILHLLGVNTVNTFEGHSIFDDRSQFPNLIGMHELGLYINQTLSNGKRAMAYDVPDSVECPATLTVSSTAPLTLCELKNFYQWKRQMFEEGRLWKP
jgi:phosphoglycerol transferase MdoB-like AlkP superfamily enzyme